MNAPSDLDVSFLYKIMERIHSLPWYDSPLDGGTFLQLVPDQIGQDKEQAESYIGRHLVYLEEVGLIQIGAKSMDRHFGLIELTADGRHFVQPELAEFYTGLTRNLVSELENQLDISSLPEERKQGFKYKLREAVAKYGPEAAAKFMVEIFKAIVAG